MSVEESRGIVVVAVDQWGSRKDVVRRWEGIHGCYTMDRIILDTILPLENLDGSSWTPMVR